MSFEKIGNFCIVLRPLSTAAVPHAQVAGLLIMTLDQQLPRTCESCFCSIRHAGPFTNNVLSLPLKLIYNIYPLILLPQDPFKPARSVIVIEEICEGSVLSNLVQVGSRLVRVNDTHLGSSALEVDIVCF